MSYIHPGHMAYRHFVEDNKKTQFLDVLDIIKAFLKLAQSQWPDPVCAETQKGAQALRGSTHVWNTTGGVCSHEHLPWGMGRAHGGQEVWWCGDETLESWGRKAAQAILKVVLLSWAEPQLLASPGALPQQASQSPVEAVIICHHELFAEFLLPLVLQQMSCGSDSGKSLHPSWTQIF